ncbi:hypothetical protein PsorP6_006559 [Peronosclerospora sorghi]|uniref:Uncharacterized protein n=1 Tax=Peronosclerospora sorghi TaxID=230839 RepID=A0ACC0W1S8_9STRA|nr:hypothetical protein PsorP6_006559 [Peronosclerospora sorghi]
MPVLAILSQRHITMMENEALLAAVAEVDVELAITQLERRKEGRQDGLVMICQLLLGGIVTDV